MKFTSFDDVQNFLDELGLFHMDFSLTRVNQALTRLNLNTLPYKVVQVVGTNGKGSTSTFLSSLAQAHGLKVGLYTSPHFVTPRERIRINGEMLAPSLWVKLVEHIVAIAPMLTYFELLTVLAVFAFVNVGVDLAILEAGLGGKYDATTAVSTDLVCYTPISLDHENFLGNTVEEIALEKAQAMRPEKPALTGFQQTKVLSILKDVAQEKNVFLHYVDNDELPCDLSSFEYYFGLSQKNTETTTPRVGLLGAHQCMNAQLALAAWQILSQSYHWELSLDNIYSGLAHAYIPGRFQYIKPELQNKCPPSILDGCHNPHGLETFAKSLQIANISPGAVIFSCFVDKNVKEMVRIVEEIAQGVPIIVPTIQVHERAMCSQELAKMFDPAAKAVQRLSLAIAYMYNAHIEISEQHPVVILGSLYLIGEFFTLYPHTLQ